MQRERPTTAVGSSCGSSGSGSGGSIPLFRLLGLPWQRQGAATINQRHTQELNAPSRNGCKSRRLSWEPEVGEAYAEPLPYLNVCPNLARQILPGRSRSRGQGKATTDEKRQLSDGHKKGSFRLSRRRGRRRRGEGATLVSLQDEMMIIPL